MKPEGFDLLFNTVVEMRQEMAAEIAKLNDKVDMLVKNRIRKDYYTVDELGKIVDKDVYTVREWLRLGRVRGTKRACGRGLSKEWIVSHEELERYRNHGLLPIVKAACKG